MESGPGPELGARKALRHLKWLRERHRKVALVTAKPAKASAGRGKASKPGTGKARGENKVWYRPGPRVTPGKATHIRFE